MSRPFSAFRPGCIAIVLALSSADLTWGQAMSPAGDSLAPVGTGFTYQGFLTQNGVPANGAWDFEIALFDAVVAGAQVGATMTLGDLSVAAGIFTASLDFGVAVFAGGARWLEIRVRPGASGGAYTTLAPRQPVTAAPVALSLPNVYADEALNFVGVGRSFRISGNEVFGVRSTLGANQYGGMFVETADAAGWPFYGYATNGSFRAWTHYDGTTGDWSLYNAGIRLRVQDEGGVYVGPAAQYSLVIENTPGSDGIRILDTGDDGIQIGSNPDVPNYGVYVPSPGVSTYGLWSNTANAAGEWAFYSVDNVQAGNVFTAGLTQIARVGGDAPLEVGDVVAASGFAAGAPGAHDLLPRVVHAREPDRLGVIGVVRSRMALVPKTTKTGDDAVALESVAGPAAPGDFVALTVRGVAWVKAEPSAVIETGVRLTVGESSGSARPLLARTIEGMRVTEDSPGVGVAVGEVDEETGFVPVYVQVR